jgi:hypothetical protein
LCPEARSGIQRFALGFAGSRIGTKVWKFKKGNLALEYFGNLDFRLGFYLIPCMPLTILGEF